MATARMPASNFRGSTRISHPMIPASAAYLDLAIDDPLGHPNPDGSPGTDGSILDGLRRPSAQLRELSKGALMGFLRMHGGCKIE